MKKLFFLVLFLGVKFILVGQDFKIDGMVVQPNLVITVDQDDMVNLPVTLNNGGMMPDLKSPKLFSASTPVIPVCERTAFIDCGCTGIVFIDNDATGCNIGLGAFDDGLEFISSLNNISETDDGNFIIQPNALAPGTYTMQLGTSFGGSSPEFKLKVTSGSTPVPALSQWGVFLFILLLFNLGLVTIYNQQLVTASKNGMLTAPRFHIPFDREAFKQILPHAFGIVVLGLGLVFLIWGKIIPDDIVGLIMAFPLVAYLLFVSQLIKK